MILDTGGGRSLPELRRLLAPHGRLVLIGSESGEGLGRVMRAAAISPFSRQRLVGLVSGEKPVDLAHLAALAAAGELRVPIAEVLPLADAADAIRRLRVGDVAGKLVLAP